MISFKHSYYYRLTLICMKYFRNVTAWNGSPGTQKENAEVNRQNYFSFSEIKLVYCLTRNTLWCNSLVQKICMFPQKEISHCRNSSALSPWRPNTIFLVTSFTQKMQKSSDSMYSSIFMLENICYRNFTWIGPNSQVLLQLLALGDLN